REGGTVILEEPTAVLTPQETQELLRIMRGLAEQGKAIVFITNKLREARAVADRITVMRAGRVVGRTTPAEATEAELAAMMVGRPVLLRIEKAPAHLGEPVLQVDDLVVPGDRGTVAVDHLS